MRLRRGRLATLASAVLFAQAAHGSSSADPARFFGTWEFQSGSSVGVGAECKGAAVQHIGIAGTRASLYTDGADGVIFDIGCHCRLRMEVKGEELALAQPQPCTLFHRGGAARGTVDTLSLRPGRSGLDVDFRASEAEIDVGIGPECKGTPFSATGTVIRKQDWPLETCGDDATAVGVLPYDVLGTAECSMNAGREGLRILLNDEDTAACSDETGSRGEGAWVLPDESGGPSPLCHQDPHRLLTTLHFCRVDGARFRAVSRDIAPGESYAVLKLGARCPNGSVEVSRTIDTENETDPITHPNPNKLLGDGGPNVVLGAEEGTFATLIFCYFRGASAAEELMPTFPDLGFPYAVFHAYDAPQPPWVVAKRWIYSPSERGASRGTFTTVGEDMREAFDTVITDGQGASTTFNLARVR